MVPGSEIVTVVGHLCRRRMTKVSFRHLQLVCHFLERLQLHLLAAVNLQQGFPINARLLECVHLRHPFLFQQFRKGAGTGRTLILAI